MMQIVFWMTTVLMTGYIALILFYRKCWKAIPDFKEDDFDSQRNLFISVIIPARNEEKNIIALLNSLKNQTFAETNFEVLVIDDFSTDNTADFVCDFPAKNIKLISLREHIGDDSINSYKKKTIETGIQLSKGELIVTTDADCITHPEWLSTIAAFYEKHQPEMIVMPVSIQPNQSFIQLFQSVDFMSLQGITGSAVERNLHGMCNGANLAYTKKAFIDVDGFKGIEDIASGDDMLLMQKITAKNKNAVKYLKSEKVIVETLPVNTIGEFFQQRIRWASKADKYQDKTLFPVLLWVYLVNFLLLLLFVLIMINYNTNYYLKLFLIIFACKTIVEIYFLIPVASFFKKQNTLWVFPFLQPMHILYTVIAGGMGKFGAYQWKGRKVK